MTPLEPLLALSLALGMLVVGSVLIVAFISADWRYQLERDV